MLKNQTRGMEKLAWIVAGAIPTVEHIASDGMAEVSEVDAYLMSAAGFDNHPEQGQWLIEFLEYLPVTDRMPATANQYRHFLTMLGMSANGRHHPAAFLARPTVYQGKILLGQPVVLKILDESTMHPLLFGDQHDPRGVFIEAMDDSGPEDIANRGY